MSHIDNEADDPKRTEDEKEIERQKQAAKREFVNHLARLRRVYISKLPERIEAVKRACGEVLAAPRDTESRAALLSLVHKLAGSGVSEATAEMPG